MGYGLLSCRKCAYYFDGFCESRNSGKYFVKEYERRCKCFKRKIK